MFSQENRSWLVTWYNAVCVATWILYVCVCMCVYMYTHVPIFLLDLFVVKTNFWSSYSASCLKDVRCFFKKIESSLSKCFSLLQSLGYFTLPKLATSQRGKNITPCLGWQSRIWGGNYVCRNLFKCIPRIIRLLYGKKKKCQYCTRHFGRGKNPFTYGFSP